MVRVSHRVSAQVLLRCLFVLLITAATTALLEQLRDHVTLLNAATIYLFVVVLVAWAWGFTAAAFAAVIVTLALNFFFVPPVYGITTTQSGDFLALALYLLVAGATAALMARASQREVASRLQERETTVLYELMNLTTADLEADSALAAICRRVRQSFLASSCAVIRVSGDRPAVVEASSGLDDEGFELAPEELEAARAAAESGLPIFLDASEAAGGVGGRRAHWANRYVAIVPGQTWEEGGSAFLRVAGVSPPPRRDDASVRLLLAFARVAAEAIERSRLVRTEATAEAVREADILKSALLSAVSHELRTPLGAIKASVTSLIDEPYLWDTGARREFLSTIDSETDRLTALITKLLQLSRLEGGALHADRNWNDLREFLETTLNPLRLGFRDHPIELEAPEAPTEAWFDYVQLGQVISNLVENAAKFSPGGAPIQVVATADPGGGIEIRVADEGRGVERQDREKIFERFYRGRNAAGTPGTGLGLAISRGIVEANGGTLALAESARRHGATFVITLPAQAPAVRREQQEQAG